jgi:predicted 2-oxoglutarate/Fe(II)-dependent dioxygenase YbiX
MDANRIFYSFEEQFGRPVILILAGNASMPGLLPVIDEVAAYRDLFADRDADVILAVSDNPSAIWRGRRPSIRTVDCGDFLGRCGVRDDGSLLLVLDRGMRVAMRLDPVTHQDVAATCLACLDDLPWEEASDVSQPAPVILLPHLLPRDVCQGLIARFESSASMDGEIARVDAAGNVRSVVDHSKKCRRDLPIPPDDLEFGWLRETLLRRCVPEIARAFQVHVAHIDRILISRYDAGAGWFRRHRDNAAANIAFREFALSVNLNTGDYDGGHVLFPEYNDHRYRAPAGGGVVFSSAVLHEVAPVTAGQRYVLLTFLHSEAAEARRLAYFATQAEKSALVAAVAA